MTFIPLRWICPCLPVFVVSMWYVHNDVLRYFLLCFGALNYCIFIMSGTKIVLKFSDIVSMNNVLTKTERCDRQFFCCCVNVIAYTCIGVIVLWTLGEDVISWNKCHIYNLLLTKILLNVANYFGCYSVSSPGTQLRTHRHWYSKLHASKSFYFMFFLSM